MSSLPDNVQINIKALTSSFQFVVERMREYFEQMSKVMVKWFPAISQAHRAEVKRVHTAYARTRRARRRRKR